MANTCWYPLMGWKCLALSLWRITNYKGWKGRGGICLRLDEKRSRLRKNCYFQALFKPFPKKNPRAENFRIPNDSKIFPHPIHHTSNPSQRWLTIQLSSRSQNVNRSNFKSRIDILENLLNNGTSNKRWSLPHTETGSISFSFLFAVPGGEK